MIPRSDAKDAMKFGRGSSAEETLRRVAELPPPAGLEDRVHERLAAERSHGWHAEGRGVWRLWTPARRLQFAAAAMLSVAVAGSTWSVYHWRGAAGTHGGAQVAAPAVPAAPQTNGFGTADGKRVPPTLAPIKAPPAPHRKPSAGTPKTAGKKPAIQAADTAQKPE
jgi:hypothetical protein